MSLDDKEKAINISIHAPASGATFPHYYYSILKKDFNPRSREWSDGIY